jgi:glycyl-tRNA synthetase beta chain
LTSRGCAADEVEAVLGAREPDALEDVAEAVRRAEALRRVRAEAREDFERLATAFKRARNILGKEKAAATVDAARGLSAARTGAYDTRLRALASLRAPVDTFFDDVLVMAEDPKVRANRLGLLQEVLSLFYRVADISRLGG